MNLRDGVDGDLVTFSVRLMHGGVVAVLVRNKEGGLDVASVRIFTLAVEDFFVQLDVVIVDGIIESDGDHLRHIFGGQVTGDHSAIFRTETVGQHALRRVAGWSAIGVVIDICAKRD